MGFVRRYPLVAYFLLSYAISWSIWYPRVAAVRGWTGPVSPYLHLWGSLGPALAAFVVASAIQGRAGALGLLRGMTRWRVGARWWAVTILGPVAVFFLGVVSARLMGRPWPQWNLATQVAEYPTLGFLALLLAEIVFYGFGEEVGWRGFALPHMQSRRSALAAAVLLSVWWTLWHVPLLMSNESYRQMNPLMLVGFYLSMLTGSILTAWLYNSTGGSILLLAVFHGLLDLGMINRAVGLEALNIMGMLYTLWGIAVLIIAGPARLARGQKVTWTLVSEELTRAA